MLECETRRATGEGLLKAAVAERDALQRELDRERGMAAQCSSEYDQVSGKVESLLLAADSMRQENTRLNLELSKLGHADKAAERARGEVMESKRQIIRLRERLEDAEELARNLSKENEVLRGKVSKAEQETNAAKKELNEARDASVRQIELSARVRQQLEEEAKVKVEEQKAAADRGVAEALGGLTNELRLAQSEANEAVKTNHQLREELDGVVRETGATLEKLRADARMKAADYRSSLSGMQGEARILERKVAELELAVQVADECSSGAQQQVEELSKQLEEERLKGAQRDADAKHQMQLLSVQVEEGQKAATMSTESTEDMRRQLEEAEAARAASEAQLKQIQMKVGADAIELLEKREELTCANNELRQLRHASAELRRRVASFGL